MFSATRALCQAAAATQRTPLIQFIGRRTWPAPESVDHSPKPHPASPTGKLPTDFTSSTTSASSSHPTFSSYRDHAQQHGPLSKTIRPETIGSMSGAQLGSVEPAAGLFFDRSELGGRFGRTPLAADEMDAIESGGASLFG